MPALPEVIEHYHYSGALGEQHGRRVTEPISEFGHGETLRCPDQRR